MIALLSGNHYIRKMKSTMMIMHKVSSNYKEGFTISRKEICHRLKKTIRCNTEPSRCKTSNLITKFLNCKRSSSTNVNKNKTKRINYIWERVKITRFMKRILRSTPMTIFSQKTILAMIIRLFKNSCPELASKEFKQIMKGRGWWAKILLTRTKTISSGNRSNRCRPTWRSWNTKTRNRRHYSNNLNNWQRAYNLKINFCRIRIYSLRMSFKSS